MVIREILRGMLAGRVEMALLGTLAKLARMVA
jgi:hypothetical protein